MKISTLTLENYRSYESFTLDLSHEKNCTVIIGDNGLGKTNLLESIYLLSIGKSFRVSGKDALINWEKDYLRCKCSLSEENLETELEFFYSKTPRRQQQLKKNKVKTSAINYVGNLLTVLFQPEDLNILYLSPQLRRKYLDSVLSQTDKYYLLSLSNYKKIIKQRNSIIKKMKEAFFEGKNIDSFKSSLEVWDLKLAEHGSHLIAKRIEFIRQINKSLSEVYQSISQANEKLEISYHSKFVKQNPDLLQIPDLAELEVAISALYPQLLHDQLQKDIYQGLSTLGPHRDDFEVKINGQLIGDSASRGEYRSILLALKMSEVDYIYNKTSKMPVLLLDDVFSELDPSRQNQLLKLVKSCQSIITTTDLSNIDDLLKDEYNLLDLTNLI